MSKAVLAIGHHTAHFSNQGYLRPIPMLKSSKNYLDVSGCSASISTINQTYIPAKYVTIEANFKLTL